LLEAVSKPNDVAEAASFGSESRRSVQAGSLHDEVLKPPLFNSGEPLRESDLARRLGYLTLGEEAKSIRKPRIIFRNHLMVPKVGPC